MQILIMIKQQLKLLFRNRIAILAAISVPLLLTYLFSLSSSSNAREKLYIADADKSAYSEQLIIMLKSHEDIEVVDSTEDIIKTKIDSQEISLGLVINKNFGENLLSEKDLDLNIVQNIENGESTILEQVITSEVSTFKKVILDSKYISSQVNSDSGELSSKIFSNLKSSTNISVDDKTLENGEYAQDNATIKLIGFLAMFIWFVVIQGFRTLIDEKENNTFSRLLSMPTNYNKYLISKVVATYIFAGLHILTILIAGKYLLKATIANNLFPVGLIFAAYLLLLTSITLFFTLFVKNQRNFTIFSSI
ncbi:MAG TPA: ABC transporter permease, partial [Clostridium sp.]